MQIKCAKNLLRIRRANFKIIILFTQIEGSGGGGGIMYIIKLSEGSVTVAVPIEIRTRNYSHSN